MKPWPANIIVDVIEVDAILPGESLVGGSAPPSHIRLLEIAHASGVRIEMFENVSGPTHARQRGVEVLQRFRELLPGRDGRKVRQGQISGPARFIRRLLHHL